ncbi:Hypothetical protein FKW44_002824 [Caligus rogercresseyi]|uniref:Uncharacterized protein n=1 Tax=Caligus rogercresseyi TaxID=217165 RepID=A0A7T8QWN7_CALRO|nr:Hypothetical protein FKW44_002824 [Caligus rogercresseyi]
MIQILDTCRKPKATPKGSGGNPHTDTHKHANYFALGQNLILDGRTGSQSVGKRNKPYAEISQDKDTNLLKLQRI